MRKMKSKNLDINLHNLNPGIELKKNIVKTVICIMMSLVGLCFWIYYLSSEKAVGNTIVKIEIVISILLLAGSLISICFIRGYEGGFWYNVLLIYLLGNIFSVLGFYIMGIRMIPVPGNGESVIMIQVLNFIMIVAVESTMIMLPVMGISILIWLIWQLFGDE